MKKLFVLFIVIAGVASWSFIPQNKDPYFQFHEKLSGYQFFVGDIKDLQPAEGLVPFDLNTPLFSNYAHKLRFIKLPKGGKAVYNDSMHFSFPKGTIFIKNFYYPNDFRKPEKGRKIIETRLLVHRQNGWDTYQYIWNDEQTDAVFEPIGMVTTVDYIDEVGKKVHANYVVPSQPQCMGCHMQNDSIVPIGPAARHLNSSYNYISGRQNQLEYWQQHDMIDLPAEKNKIPANAVWNEKESGTIEEHARAYLDINCGHCHNKSGPANTSGLFLNIHETNSTALGLFKTPVAAGQGSGGHRFDIVPGKPDESILVYRMKTANPGFAMPELGREQVHKEGVALIEKWIKEMR